MNRPDFSANEMSRTEWLTAQLDELRESLLPETRKQKGLGTHVTYRVEGANLVGVGVPRGGAVVVDLTRYPRNQSRDLCLVLTVNRDGKVYPTPMVYLRPTTGGTHLVCRIDEIGRLYDVQETDSIYGVVVTALDERGKCLWTEEETAEEFPTYPPVFAKYYARDVQEGQKVGACLGTPKEAVLLAPYHNHRNADIAQEIAEECEGAAMHNRRMSCTASTLATVWNAGRIQGIREERYRRRQQREKEATTCG